MPFHVPGRQTTYCCHTVLLSSHQPFFLWHDPSTTVQLSFQPDAPCFPTTVLPFSPTVPTSLPSCPRRPTVHLSICPYCPTFFPHFIKFIPHPLIQPRRRPWRTSTCRGPRILSVFASSRLRRRIFLGADWAATWPPLRDSASWMAGPFRPACIQPFVLRLAHGAPTNSANTSNRTFSQWKSFGRRRPRVASPRSRVHGFQTKRAACA